MTLIVHIPKKQKNESPITLREKVHALAQCKLFGNDPRQVVPALYQQRGLPVPKHPAQPLTGFAKLFKNLVAKGDAEAISLAREFGFDLVEAPNPEVSAKDPSPAD